jgi:hypothetical protein
MITFAVNIDGVLVGVGAMMCIPCTVQSMHIRYLFTRDAQVLLGKCNPTSVAAFCYR